MSSSMLIRDTHSKVGPGSVRRLQTRQDRLNQGLFQVLGDIDPQIDKLDKINKLIQQVADVNAEDSHGLTPLILASDRGYTELAKLLIEKGADVNASNDGKTPLMFASSNGCTEIVELLKQHEAK